MANKWDFPVKGKPSKKPARRHKPKKADAKDERIAELEAELRQLKGEKEFDLEETVARGIELSLLLTEAKEWYKERDEIIEKLLSTGQHQFEYDGTILTLEDHFATGNKRWKSVPCNRYEIEITERK
jgi:hypothetical protein